MNVTLIILYFFVALGNSLWSYCCLHLTKHEKERFKILSNINTPLGYFRAFLRASLNERSLERYNLIHISLQIFLFYCILLHIYYFFYVLNIRYLQSWVSHGLLIEYYDEGAFVRSPEANILPSVASGKIKINIL